MQQSLSYEKTKNQNKCIIVREWKKRKYKMKTAKV